MADGRGGSKSTLCFVLDVACAMCPQHISGQCTLKTAAENLSVNRELAEAFAQALGGDVKELTVNEVLSVRVRDLENAVEEVQVNGALASPLERAVLVGLVRTLAQICGMVSPALGALMPLELAQYSSRVGKSAVGGGRGGESRDKTHGTGSKAHGVREGGELRNDAPETYMKSPRAWKGYRRSEERSTSCDSSCRSRSRGPPQSASVDWLTCRRRASSGDSEQSDVSYERMPAQKDRAWTGGRVGDAHAVSEGWQVRTQNRRPAHSMKARRDSDRARGSGVGRKLVRGDGAVAVRALPRFSCT